MESTDHKIAFSDHRSSVDHDTRPPYTTPKERLEISQISEMAPDANDSSTNTVTSNTAKELQTVNLKSTNETNISIVINRFESNTSEHTDSKCEPGISTRPLVRSSFTFEITRKRSRLEGDVTASGDAPSAQAPLSNPIKRQTSLTSEVSTAGPIMEPMSVGGSRPASLHPIKRPSSLPIPSQMCSSPGPTRDANKLGVTTFTGPDSNTVNFRNLLSGRRISVNPAASRANVRGENANAPLEPNGPASGSPSMLNVFAFSPTTPTAATATSNSESQRAREAVASGWEPVPPEEVGFRAPVLSPDHMSRLVCMLCAVRFSLVRQRQHCRACGRVLCPSCCARRAPLPFFSPSAAGSALSGRNAVSPLTERLSPSMVTSLQTINNGPVTSYQRSQSVLNRLARVCEPCYEILVRSQSKGQLSSSGHPPSPKRQRSDPQLASQQSATLPCKGALTVNVTGANLTEAGRQRHEELLHPTEPVYAEIDGGLSAEERWPPLVTGVHTRIALQSDPPKSVLLALLNPESDLQFSADDSCDSSQKLNNRWAHGADVQSVNESMHRHGAVSSKTASHIAVRPAPTAGSGARPGLTLAVTRNVHVHVHSTQLACCLRTPAWCFTSVGLQSFGQPELVLVVRRQPDDPLPPLSVYRFYQQLYLAVSSPCEESADKDQITLVPSDEPTTGLFHAYDTFIPHRCRPHQSVVPTPMNGHRADSTLAEQFVQSADTFPFGCLFYPPTHQCLAGLQLPTTPFLMGLLFPAPESYWACHLPLRLLLRLGKQTRYYPTSLLCDLDREALFDCARDAGLLPWLHLLTTPQSEAVASDRENGCDRGPPAPPELVARVRGLRIRLCCTGRSGPHLPTARLELCIPARQQSTVYHFLDSLSSTCGVFALAGDLDPSADSHLICMQPESDSSPKPTSLPPVDSASLRPYMSGAISIANTSREVTGASFAAFISNSPYTTVGMVEDGVLVQLPSECFAQLVNGLAQCKNVRFEVPSLALKESLVSCVTVLWEDEADRLLSLASSTVGPSETSRTSWIDMECLSAERTYLVPPRYQLVHWLQPSLWFSSDRATAADLTPSTPVADCAWPSSRLAWARLHLLRPLLSECSGKPPDLGELANRACGAIVQSLRPHADDLRRHNHTQLAVRVHLQPPDQVGYQVASLPSELDVLVPSIVAPTAGVAVEGGRVAVGFSSSSNTHSCSFDLERYLIPAMRSWLSQMDFLPSGWDAVSSSSSPSGHTPTSNGTTGDCPAQLVFELDFYLLD